MAQFDVVLETRRCAALLAQGGLLDWSRKLVDAIESAATGGELVMAVRWTLTELRKSGEPIPLDVSSLADRIVDEISRTGW